MVVIYSIFFLTISVLLICIGRILHQIKSILQTGKEQLEEYLRIVCDPTLAEEEYSVGDEEKKMLWSMEEKEQLFNEVLQEMFH